MNAADILTALRADGLALTAEGDRIRVEPGERLTDEALALIRANKSALLELLRASEPVRSAPSDYRTATVADSFVNIDREAFEERAGILEYDGGYARPEAELLAAWEATQALFARLTSREWLARYAPQRLPAGDSQENHPVAQIRPGNDFFLERERRSGGRIK